MYCSILFKSSLIKNILSPPAPYVDFTTLFGDIFSNNSFKSLQIILGMCKLYFFNNSYCLTLLS